MPRKNNPLFAEANIRECSQNIAATVQYVVKVFVQILLKNETGSQCAPKGQTHLSHILV